MEPTSLAVGAVGLVGLFSTCMQCFECIEYGKRFGSDYEHAACILDVSRLRLSRWATSIGLNDDPEQQLVLEKQLSPHEANVAKALLGNIVEAFENVERLSKRYEKTQWVLNEAAATDEEAGLGIVEASSADASKLSARLSRIHLGVKNKIQSRQKFTRTRDKARWALYEKKRFDDLVRDIKDLTDDLVNNFPAAKVDHTRLAAEEVQEITEDAEDRLLLKEFAEDTDPILQKAVEKEITILDGHLYENIRVEGQGKVFMGSDVAHGTNVKGNIYRNMVVRGNATLHAGNIYRSKGQAQIEFSGCVKRQ